VARQPASEGKEQMTNNELLKAWLAEMETFEARQDDGGLPSAHDYYAEKDRLRRHAAKLVGKTECEYDPMGFWFGQQSN
jgi:hypothetical protein